MYKYTGTDGAHFPGIPARDLDDRDLDALGEGLAAVVKASSIYQHVPDHEAALVTEAAPADHHPHHAEAAPTA